ncbi:MAG: hypothetical protein Q9203_002655, partial [Teloschistes exilis]
MLRTFASVILVALVTAFALAAPTPEDNQLFPRGSNENDEHSAALSLDHSHLSGPPVVRRTFDQGEVEQRSTESPSGSSACEHMRCAYGTRPTFVRGKCLCPSTLRKRQLEPRHARPAPPFPLMSKRETNLEAEDELEERKLHANCAFKLNCAYLSHPVRQNGVCVCVPSPNKKRHVSESPEIKGPKHLNLDKRDQSMALESRDDAVKCTLKKHCPLGQYGYLIDGQCICHQPGPEHPWPGKRELVAASEAGTASEDLKVGTGNGEGEDAATESHREDTENLDHA